MSVTAVADLAFFGACAMLIAHELDAVHKREWRLLFILRTMPNDRARSIFVLLHVPLITLIIWLVSHSDPRIQTGAVIGVSVFAIIHAVLHWRLSGDPRYTFNTAHSRFFIFGAALLALVHLSLLWYVR